jgi:MerR family transcriptional regulator, thiopeptide resistance regulator
MRDSLDIAEVARLTGLTSRALRFYEARGLVMPLRTASGRRHYGPAELERLHQIVAMKRAGLTLAQIHAMTAGRRIDLRALVAAQVEVLADREREIAGARALLEDILSRIDRSEPIDVATFCSLIRQGAIMMSQDKWAEVQQRYMSREQRAAYEHAIAALPADFDYAAHHAKWKDLDRRIVAALPLDPASPQAQAFLDEWDAQIAPFVAVAQPAMLEGMGNMLDNIEQWAGEADPGFSVEAYRFHQAAYEVRERMKR